MAGIIIPDSNRLENFVKPGGKYRSAGVSPLLAAHLAGYHGCFVDTDDNPQWARKIERRCRAEFLERAKYAHFDEHAGPLQNFGSEVDRSCNWVYATRLLDDFNFEYFQNTGSCVHACMGGKAIPQLIGTAILKLRQAAVLPARGSVMYYANRGHGGQGDSVVRAANDYESGIPFRQVYCGGKYDLRDEDADERLAASLGRRGVPADLQAEFDDQKLLAVSYMDEVSWDRVRDVIAAGGIIATGSNATISGAGDPVSPRTKRIGGHAQVIGGFDQSEEFRLWYRETTGKTIDEPVLMCHQTWGDNWLRVTNWPEHLWGKRPEGMGVLKWSDARNYCRTTVAYLPDFSGLSAEPVKWKTS